MEAVGGLDILVRFAAKIIRAKPKMVGVVAPVVSFFLTFFAGTGNAVYALLPVVYEVSYNAGVRPEPAMAGTQSPVRLVLQPARLPLLWLR